MSPSNGTCDRKLSVTTEMGQEWGTRARFKNPNMFCIGGLQNVLITAELPDPLVGE